ncbi:Dynein light chain roadblock-type 2 [Chytriomyces hyalinus]|nr:Dynein light chain roadblock-type 2 [Chytriomyces hyalinus]
METTVRSLLPLAKLVLNAKYTGARLLSILISKRWQLTRIQGHKGVHGLVIATHDGSVIKSTLDNIQTQQYSTLVTQLAAKGKGVVRDLDPEDDLTFLRIRSKKHEIMVAETKSYLLICIQNPHEL